MDWGGGWGQDGKGDGDRDVDVVCVDSAFFDNEK